MGHPTVAVTLLFTDIEGSTALAHELGDDYVELLAQHNRIVRDAIGHFVGVEARNEGDSFFAVFDRASDAVSAALEAQRALGAHTWPHGRPLRVRMGLHTGAVVRLLHDFAGLNVHLASRVSSCAHGGQVVVSQAVVDALDADAFAWIELGAHIVKDFPEPITLYQLAAAGLDTKFPPLVTIDARDHNLPAMVTSFVGRQHELGELRGLLSGGARLVSLIGPGGVGKTRLAIEATWSVLSRFREGAWFVDFAPVRDPALIHETIADAIGVREREGASHRELIAEKFAAGPALLLLDNLEHLLTGAVAIADLLAACPKLVVLATTREHLRLQGEHEVAVAGLDVAEAVELFAARAALVRRDVVVDDRVSALCERVGCLPLAIELAAARTRTLSVDALLAAMSNMLDALSQGERDRPERHQAMRAAIALSVDALTEAERSVFRGFAVFGGGARHDAIAAVCAPKADEVQSLVEKSLLGGAGDRFAMLEPIRQFAEERLRQDVPGEYDQRVQAHAEYFVAFAERIEPDLVTTRQRDALDALTADHANLRLALDRAQGDAPLRLASALSKFWNYRGHPHEGRVVLDRVLAEHPDADPTVRAKALVGAGMLASLQGDADSARQQLEDAIAIGDPTTRGTAHGLLAQVASASGDLDGADEHCLLALRFAQDAADERLIAVVRVQQGVVEFARGEYSSAAETWRDALARSEAVGDTATAIRAVGNLSAALRALDDLPGATQACEHSLALARSNGDRGAEARALVNLAATISNALVDNTDVERLKEPASYFFAAVAIFEELDFKRELAATLVSTPAFVADAEQALRGLARARALYVQLGDENGIATADAYREAVLAKTAG